MKRLTTPMSSSNKSFDAAARTRVESLNKEALGAVQSGKFADAKQLLEQALTLTEARSSQSSMSPEQRHWETHIRRLLRSTTLNNFGVMFRSQGKLREAWACCNRALKLDIVELQSGFGNPATSHLNLCAIMSQMGK